MTDVVWWVSKDFNVTSIPVGARPDDVVYANGIVWVATYDDGSVSKVDPCLAQELTKYPVGIRFRALAAANAKVWMVGMCSVWRTHEGRASSGLPAHTTFGPPPLPICPSPGRDASGRGRPSAHARQRPRI